MNTRVLMIGAHPDDEDTFLIAWLQRGRHVETAYLSLTRGDGGQNAIGNELGEALGVIRTEELLAARRIDGAKQYFTRAFDFGFSKDTVDTYKFWQRDSILRDIVHVVRAFRPHVIIAVFSGTSRDGHGHHQVSGLLARVAYDVAGDVQRVPLTPNEASWTPLKFYRVARGNAQNGTLGVDVGEYSPLLGRSYAEIAGESRSEHKSQAFGAPQRKGPVMNYVTREASRVNEASPARGERSIFDGIDTSWVRFRAAIPVVQSTLDSLPKAIADAQSAFDARAPERLLAPLRVVSRMATSLQRGLCPSGTTCAAQTDVHRDFWTSRALLLARASRAALVAAGISIEAVAAREVVPAQSTVPVVVTVYNRGRDTIRVSSPNASYRDIAHVVGGGRVLAPGGVQVDTLQYQAPAPTSPRWMSNGRVGGMFGMEASTRDAAVRQDAVVHSLSIGPAARPLPDRPIDVLHTIVETPIMFRVVDQVRGELWRPLAVVRGAVSVSMPAPIMFAPANIDIDREFTINLRAHDDSVRDVIVAMTAPAGTTLDDMTKRVRIGGRDSLASVTFRVRGRMRPRSYLVRAYGETESQFFSNGFELIDYPHIEPQRVNRRTEMQVIAMDVRVPANLRVAYIPGVGDNSAGALEQLGVQVTTIAAKDIARADLASYTTVVIGPRAYDANPQLLAANPKLFEFARKGGTLVVQYGQYEMTQPGAMPFQITLSRPADRVTLEDAPITIDAPNAKELISPHRITSADFDGWVQERGLYMPRTFDPVFRSLISTNDPNEPANKGGILVAPLGDGLYIYTSLSFFRQLPAGVPGAARLFVNLLSAKLAPPSPTP